MKRQIIVAATLLMAAQTASTQTLPALEGYQTFPTTQADNDFGTDLSLEVEKKLAPGLELSLEANYRTQDNSKRTEFWQLGTGLSYRLLRTADKRFSLKANAGFEYRWKQILDQMVEKYETVDLEDEGIITYQEGYNWTQRHWRQRHRTSAGLSASYSPSKRWTFSLKETFQYNHYCRIDSVARIKYRWRENGDSDEMTYRELVRKEYKAKDKTVLRSKLTVEYNIKGLPLNPYASVDYGVGLNYGAHKWKYTVGTDYKVNKQQKLTLFYRFQHEDDDDEPNGHLIGLGYKFSF